MRLIALSLSLLSFAMLSACDTPPDIESELKDLNVLDETDLSDLMLTVADPNEAVAYFSRTSLQYPDRIDVRRNLALSLNRAKLHERAATTWADVVKMKGATPEDGVQHAGSLIRNGQWTEAKAVLNQIPPTHETYDRYRFEAMIADANKDWVRADSFYEIAAGLTTTPASIYNNWGFSNLNRGNYNRAERLFEDALRYEPSLFTAKNNMALARAKQRNYTLPLIKMTQLERAQLLYTLGLSAVKQRDVNTGRELLLEAVATHPQYFEEAERALSALGNG